MRISTILTTVLLLLWHALLHGQTIHIVNSVNDVDDGVCNAIHCSLREAINAANMNAGPDSIAFNIPGPGPHIIFVTGSGLPGITDPQLIIDGTSQPGNSPMAGQIIIDGSLLPPGPSHGLVIYRENTRIYGLQIQNFPAHGIQIFGGAFGGAAYLSDLTIGAPGRGNVLIGNSTYGIDGPVDQRISIRGNYIGTDLQFTQGLGNGWDGIFLDVLRGTDVTVGGMRGTGQENYLCSNGFSGLRIRINDPAQFQPGFTITGNVIGTDAAGTVDLGNAGNDLSGNRIGGGIILLGDGRITTGGPGVLANVIAYNYDGIYTTDDNRKTVLENSFYCNSNAGIRLENNANDGIPAPQLCLQGNFLQGTAPPNVMVDVYLDDPSGCIDVPCQGRTFLARVPADAAGNWTYNISANPGGLFTAVAQDGQGNTSEFSDCLVDPNVQAFNTGPYCFGDQLFLSATIDSMVPGVSFSWEGPGGYTSTMQNPIDAILPGIYMVMIDFGGCNADTAYTDVMIYPLASDTLTNFCIDDQFIVNGTVYDISNPSGIEVIPGAASTGCDSVVVIALALNHPITGTIHSTRPLACAGDTIQYWFALHLGPSLGTGPHDVVYTDGSGTVDTLFGIFDGHLAEIVVYGDVRFEILDILSDLTICDPILNPSDTIAVSTLAIAPEVSDYSGFGVSCFGASDGMIILNASGGYGETFFNWSVPSISTDSALALISGSYAVTVVDDAGCTVLFDSIISSPPPFEAVRIVNATSCPGVEDGVIIIDALTGARGTLMYSFDEGPLTPAGNLPLTLDGLAPGPKTLTLMDSAGCTIDLSLFVPVGPPPVLNLGGTQSIFSGDSVLLNFTTSLTPEQVSWSPSSVVSCPDCAVTYAFPTQTGYISVIAVDAIGCVAADSVLIQVFVPKRVYIPNIFSPNGDGINDIFYINTNAFAVAIDYLIISDRWGNVVYEKHDIPANDPAYGWDGTLLGKPMMPAVFTYLAQIRFSDNDIVPYSGTVTLVR